MRKLPFYILDVFAEQKYAGNQLAVFVKPEGITNEEMQQIAFEVNYAETTFILSDKQEDGGYEVRIFTPAEEVPFAGHPTLGTAFVIHKMLENSENKEVILNLKVGQIKVSIEEDYFWMQQINPIFGQEFPVDSLDETLGLIEDDFDTRFPIAEISTGLPFLIVPLKNLNAVKRSKVDLDKLMIHVEKEESLARAVLVFSPETYNKENDLNARMFAEELGVVEDAATGSANGCLLAYLLKYNYFGKSSIAINVEQGYEMNRPSLLKHNGTKISEEDYEINIGGKVQLIAEGAWY